MKYPKQQFEVLKDTIKALHPLIDTTKVNPHTLHFIIFEQFSQGHDHNWLYCTPSGQLAKKHAIADLTDCRKLIEREFSFELYPNDCNDDNIATAMRAAFKELNLSPHPEPKTIAGYLYSIHHWTPGMLLSKEVGRVKAINQNEAILIWCKAKEGRKFADYSANEISKTQL